MSVLLTKLTINHMPNNDNQLYVNGRFLSQRMTGIQRFAYEICCALQQIGVPLTIIAPIDIREEYDLSNLSIDIIGGKGSHFWEQVTLPRYMRQKHNGHILLNLSGLSPILYNNNILTIHDISYQLRPRSYSLAYCLYYQLMTPLAAKRARKILTVSQFSKQELIDHLGIAPQRIAVVYNAVRPTPLLPREETERYLLAVGSLVPRKNIKRLLKAYCSIQEPDYALYIVGGMHAIYADAELSSYTTKKGVHFLGYVGGNKLTSLYRNATAYINPSLYEGFGIPLVEAMTQQCPVIVSDIPAFHEVCGEAARYFNPTDIQDIQDKMNLLMHDAELRKQLAERGFEQAKQFSWERSAEQIKQLIHAL